MKDFFKPEDFKDCEDNGLSCVRANEKLNKLIESMPVVYQLEPKTNYGWYQEKDHYKNKYKYQARLAFIEEIKKECPMHEPRVSLGIGMNDYEYKAFCKHCKVELQATWSEKK